MRQTGIALGIALILATCATISTADVHTITAFEMTPPSPATLVFSDLVDITFDYTTDSADGVYIYAEGYTGGSPASNQLVGSSPNYPAGSGSGTTFFTITSGETTVDQVRLWMTDEVGTVLYETFIPVDYHFTDHALFNIQMTPPSPASLVFDEQVDITFDYTTNEAGGVRIFTMPYTGGAPTPNLSVDGSPPYPVGSGSGTSSLTITSGETTVDQVRVWMMDAASSVVLSEVFIPVDYDFHEPHAITNIQMTPPSPASLALSEHVDITFDYVTNEADGVRIFVTAFTDGVLNPVQGVNPSPVYPAGSGSGTGFFTIHYVGSTVDEIRFQMMNADMSALLLEFFIPVDYQFTDHAITNIQMTPPSPASLALSEHVDITFDYVTNEADGVRIFVTAFTDGVLNPVQGVNPSPVYPAGSGSGTGFFTIHYVGSTVDEIRFQMMNADMSAVLLEFSIPVEYDFHGPNVITNIQMTPPSPASLALSEHVDITFDYITNEADGVRIFARPFTGGALTPGYGGHSSPIYPVGSGSGTGFFTIHYVGSTVDEIRFQVMNADMSALLLEVFIPVDYQFTDYAITNIQLTPPSPASLRFNDQVNITFDYITNEADGVSIFARPFTDGAPTPGYSAHPSPIYPAGSGVGVGFFTVMAGENTVDQIRFQMMNANMSALLLEVFIPVDYHFSDPHAIFNIQMTPPSPAALALSEHVDITFDYVTDEAGGVRIFVTAFTDGVLNPGQGVNPSPVYPIGGGSGTGFFTIHYVEDTVDEIRFQMLNADMSTVLLEFFIPVDYHFADNALSNISLKPPSPGSLAFGERVYISFDYVTNEADGVHVFITPFTGGAPVSGLGIEVSPSPLYPVGSGEGTQFFTINFGETVVDQLRLLMVNTSKDLVLETFIPANYHFSGAPPIPLSVSLPDRVDAPIDQPYSVPVSVDDIMGRGYTSLQAVFTYDGDVIHPVDVVTTGTMTEGWGSYFNILPGSSPDTLEIAMATAEDTLRGAGVLFMINVEATAGASAGDSTGLHFEYFRFDEDTTGVITEDGTLHLIDLIRRLGDATNNGEVSSYDAAWVLQHAVGLRTLAGADSIAADVSGRMGLSAFDASLILQYVVHIIHTFPADTGGTDDGAVKTFAFARTISVGEATRRADGRLSVPILIDEMDDVVAGEISLSFSGDAGDITVQTSDLTDNYLFACSIMGGRIRAAFAGPESNTGPGALLELILDPSSAELLNTLRLERVSLNEENIPAHFITSSTPTIHRLSQNHPNPFNPYTTITYTIEQAGDLHLCVYTLSGQLVRTFVHGERPAGSHSISWDGTDDTGQDVASGVYLCRMEIGEFRAVRKMMLVR